MDLSALSPEAVDRATVPYEARALGRSLLASVAAHAIAALWLLGLDAPAPTPYRALEPGWERHVVVADRFVAVEAPPAPTEVAPSDAAEAEAAAAPDLPDPPASDAAPIDAAPSRPIQPAADPTPETQSAAAPEPVPSAEIPASSSPPDALPTPATAIAAAVGNDAAGPSLPGIAPTDGAAGAQPGAPGTAPAAGPAPAAAAGPEDGPDLGRLRARYHAAVADRLSLLPDAPATLLRQVQGLPASITLRAVVDERGRILEVVIERSSGVEELDEFAVQSLWRLRRIAAVPPELGAGGRELTIPLVFDT